MPEVARAGVAVQGGVDSGEDGGKEVDADALAGLAEAAAVSRGHKTAPRASTMLG